MKSTHSDRIERWLGAEGVQYYSQRMRGWPAGPIALAGVPGDVYVTGDGDFVGNIHAGQEASWLDMGRDVIKRLQRSPFRRNQALYTGFASLMDFIQEAKFKRQEVKYQSTGLISSTQNLFYSVFRTASGNSIPTYNSSAPSAAPGGRATTITDGGISFNNAASGDTLHFYSAWTASTCGVPATSGVFGATGALLYDRLFDVASGMTTDASEAVTGTIARYTSTTKGATDFSGGNFCFAEVEATLGNTAHNYTLCTYTDQDGNTAQTFPDMTGNPAAAGSTLDHPTFSFFMPFATGDYGVNNLTNIRYHSGTGINITGNINFAVGHPIAWIPIGPNLFCKMMEMPTSLNFTRVYDNALLHLLFSGIGGNNAATDISVGITLVSG